MEKEKPKHNPQKFSWKKISIYDTYEEANDKREELKVSENKYIKIRRCGPAGTKFKVLIGEKLKKKKEK